MLYGAYKWLHASAYCPLLVSVYNGMQLFLLMHILQFFFVCNWYVLLCPQHARY